MLRWPLKMWHGGIAGDRFLGIANSVQSAKNVDLRKNGRQIVLAKKMVRNASGVIADLPMAKVTIQSTGDVIAFGDTGKIYRQAAGTGDFALVYTDTSNRKITDAYEFNSYLYWATSSNLHRIAIANIDASWSGDVTENYKTFTAGNATHHPMIEVYNNLFIGDGKYVAKLDSFGVFTGNRLSIFADEIVVGLTFNGANLRITSRRTTSVPYGRVYLWDCISDDYNQFFTIKGLAPHAVIEKSNLDYIIAGNKPVLLASAGLDYQVIQELPGFDNNDSATFNHNTMTASESLIYFGACESGTNTINRGVWSYGAKNKNFTQCLGNEFTTSNSSSTDVVGSVHYSGGKIYTGWKNGSTYGIDVVDNTLYAATGEVVTRVWDAGMGEQKKELIKAKLSFATLADGEQIDLYLRRNLSTSWGTAVINVSYATLADRNINYKELPTNLLGDPFNFLEAKLVLTAGTNYGTTPAVCDLIIDAEPIEI